MKMLKLTKSQIIQLLLFYSFLAIAAWLHFNLKKFWGPTRKRPFQCFDEDIEKPFVAEDTIPSQQLELLGIYLPLIFLAVSELSLSFCQRNTTNKSSSRTWLVKGLLKYVVVLSLFLMGLVMERLTKNFAKQKMARLRPNFLTVCDPIDADGSKCLDLMEKITMTDYKCSSTSYPQWAIDTAFHSFPSGHSSLSAYGMIFIACYLHLLGQQMKKSQAFVLLAFRIMQILCVFVALFVAISRVFDFRHHVSDVCAGFLLGSAFALAINWCLKSHMENINIWLRRVFDQSTVQDSIKITRLNAPTLPEKETSYGIV